MTGFDDLDLEIPVSLVVLIFMSSLTLCSVELSMKNVYNLDTRTLLFELFPKQICFKNMGKIMVHTILCSSSV